MLSSKGKWQISAENVSSYPGYTISCTPEKIPLLSQMAGSIFIKQDYGLVGSFEGFFLGIFRDLISKVLFEKSSKLILGF